MKILITIVKNFYKRWKIHIILNYNQQLIISSMSTYRPFTILKVYVIYLIFLGSPDFTFIEEVN
jgi:hypothetical protein